MIADRGRTAAYAAALNAAVAPESAVLDIGAGPGIFTLLACKAGARKVYAIEPDGSIEVVREAAAANGFEDRVEFIQALSTEITLPEQVDVIVASIQGALPFFGCSVLSILDARDRFLKPGGTIIPLRETLRAAVVSAHEFYRKVVDPWENCFGLDYEAARCRAVNTADSFRLPRESPLVEPRVWTVLDYSHLNGLSARGEVAWTIGKSCVAHGLGVWFDCEAAPGIGFSNAPGVPDSNVFRQTFFPWPEPCRLEPGDNVIVEIRADFVGGEYIFGWNTDICNAGGTLKARFRQSQFQGSSFSRDILRKSGSAFVPCLKPEAAIDKMILDLFSDGLNLEEISRRIAGCFPDRFPEWRKALTRVGELSQRYSQ
jgi:protein arginine N-methyltransferase 1